MNYFLFVLLGCIWGSNFIMMKFAVETISPLQVVFLRVVSGFIPLFLYALYKRQIKREHLKHWPHFLAMSFLATSVYFYGFVKGAEYLYSGVAGAVSGAIPIFSLVAALLLLEEEKLTMQRVYGVSVGFVGILLIANPFAAQMSPTLILGILWMLFGSLSFGVSFVYARKYLSHSNVQGGALVTYQLGLSSLFLALITSFEGVEIIAKEPVLLLSTVLGLGFLGTGIAYLIYYHLVRVFGAVKAASVTYLPPVVALLISILSVGEPIKLVDIVGAALIAMGVFVLNYKKRV